MRFFLRDINAIEIFIKRCVEIYVKNPNEHRGTGSGSTATEWSQSHHSVSGRDLEESRRVGKL